MTSGAAVVVSDSTCVAVAAGVWRSRACTVNVAVSTAVGVPEMTPALSNARPAGKAPAIMDQAYGAVPPVAASVVAYEAPTVPAGTALVEITRGGGAMLSVSARVALAAGTSASVTSTMKELVPAVVGVPEMAPALLSVSPDGSVPDASDQL